MSKEKIYCVTKQIKDLNLKAARGEESNARKDGKYKKQQSIDKAFKMHL